MLSIFLPVLIQVGLTLSVLLTLALKRQKAIKKDPSLLHRAAVETTAYDEDCRKTAANYANQFELPVLFYLAAVFAVLFGVTGFWAGLLAWIFVLSRIAHTIIHTTLNIVVARFMAFLTGLIAVILLWLTIAFSAQGAMIFDMNDIEERRDAIERRLDDALSGMRR